MEPLLRKGAPWVHCHAVGQGPWVTVQAPGPCPSPLLSASRVGQGIASLTDFLCGS